MAMYLVRLAIIAAVGVAACGCTHSRGFIRDYQRYDSGQPKGEAVVYYDGKSQRQTHVSEFYENGRLKSDEWSEFNRPLIKLAFYESGRLKSEERFSNGQLTFGVYYSDAGEVERTIGERLAWATKQTPGK